MDFFTRVEEKSRITRDPPEKSFALARHPKEEAGCMGVDYRSWYWRGHCQPISTCSVAAGVWHWSVVEAYDDFCSVDLSALQRLGKSAGIADDGDGSTGQPVPYLVLVT